MPHPPGNLLEGASLFLDLDGTLLDLIDRPDEVVADAELRNLLARLMVRLDHRLAVISGRSLAQVDAILGDIADELAVSGSHGTEYRWQGIWAGPERPATLDVAADRLRFFANTRDGVLVEEKSYGVALHYRMNPAVECEAQAVVARLADELGLGIQHGKMMVELRVADGDKGRAVRHLMSRAPMTGTRPIFIGDDLTDEPGFVTAREFGGHGILVGPLRPSAADYGLSGPAELRRWLEGSLK